MPYSPPFLGDYHSSDGDDPRMTDPDSPTQQEGKSFVSRVATDDDDPGPAHESPWPAQRRSKGLKPPPTKNDAYQQQIGKIRHLKKEDGEPLWREDIQHDFLRAIFDNEQKVFHNSYEPDRMQCFADLYIDTMSRSSKTSKVLRDKLLTDREAAKGMAMVCLLVNMGRMNTTLNCLLALEPPSSKMAY
jgi:Ino eighty subunit 1